MDEDTLVSMRNERERRWEGAQKAAEALDLLKQALDLLVQLALRNGEGRYTFPMHALIDYVDRLRVDTAYYVGVARDGDINDIPF